MGAATSSMTQLPDWCRRADREGQLLIDQQAGPVNLQQRAMSHTNSHGGALSEHESCSGCRQDLHFSGHRRRLPSSPHRALMAGASQEATHPMMPLTGTVMKACSQIELLLVPPQRA